MKEQHEIVKVQNLFYQKPMCIVNKIYGNLEKQIYRKIFIYFRIKSSIPYLKSLSPIYFVNIQLPDLCYEFLIKMHRLLQNYTFEIEIFTLSKITNIWCKYNILLEHVGLYLQAMERWTRDFIPTYTGLHVLLSFWHIFYFYR